MMTDDEHQARITEAREFHKRHLQFHPEDQRPAWVWQMSVLLDELERDGKIIDGLYEALGPANDDVLAMVIEEVDRQ